LQHFKSATRKEIDKLLWNKLSDALDKDQKLKKIDNLLTMLRSNGQIKNISSRRIPIWQLNEEKIRNKSIKNG
jgi:ATP-dependent DNA helicase RecG